MTTSVEHGTNKSDRIPPLESGDRLTRHEFEQGCSSAATRVEVNRTRCICAAVITAVLDKNFCFFNTFCLQKNQTLSLENITRLH